MMTASSPLSATRTKMCCQGAPLTLTEKRPFARISEMNDVCFFWDLSFSPAPSFSASRTSDAISRHSSAIENERTNVAETEEISLTMSDKGGAEGRVVRQPEMSAAARGDMAARTKSS